MTEPADDDASSPTSSESAEPEPPIGTPVEPASSDTSEKSQPGAPQPGAPQPGAPQPGATCSFHAERPATLTCLRCGDFVCDDCRHGGKLNVCERCAASGVPERELDFPFADGRWTWTELVDWNVRLFKNHGLLLCAVLLIGGVMTYGIGMMAIMPVMFSFMDFSGNTAANAQLGTDPRFQALMILSSVPLYVLGIYLFTGLKRLCLDVHLGRRLEAQRLFIRPGLALKAIGVYVLIYLFPMIFGQVQQLVIQRLGINPLDPLFILGNLLVPVVFCFYHGPLLLAVPHIVHRPEDGVLAAIRASWRLTRGRRIACSLFYLALTFGSGLGIFACCVGVVVVPVFMQLLEVGLYLAIRAERRAAGEL